MYNILSIYEDLFDWYKFYMWSLFYVEVFDIPYSLEYYSIELINENYNQFLNYFNYVKN